MTWRGVSKSGSPISRWMTSRPRASSARAFTSTSKADSVPIRSIRLAIFMLSCLQRQPSCLRHGQAQLLVYFPQHVRPRFAEPDVAGRRGVKAAREYVFTRRPLLQHKLGTGRTGPHDPAKEREVPVSVEMNPAPRL